MINEILQSSCVDIYYLLTLFVFLEAKSLANGGELLKSELFDSIYSTVSYIYV